MKQKTREILRAIPAIDYVWISTLAIQTGVAVILAIASASSAEADSAVASVLFSGFAVMSASLIVTAVRSAWRRACAKLSGQDSAAPDPASPQEAKTRAQWLNRTAFWAVTFVTIYMVLDVERHVPGNPAAGSLLLLAFYAGSLWLIRSGLLSRLLARIAG